MPDFTAKLHQIGFRLELCSRPAGELTVLPDPLAEFRGKGGVGFRETDGDWERDENGEGGDWEGRGVGKRLEREGGKEG